MKTRHILAAVAATLLCSAAAIAQAPAGAPAGATGTCKDGTYSTAASKSGACSGHKGVAAWYGPAAAPKAAAAPKTAAAAPAPAPAPAPAAKPAPAPTPAPAPMAATKPAPTAKGAKTPAAGGGPGLVWVNTSTKVYHCYGKEDYGTTKAGKYESEAQAKADGFRPAYNKACGM
ncbi:Protein of unknown function [Bryocella elongata]|uniref:DUF3761 domain-containing protein n=1 Tax=Bryocella elongata TaxID=863522 RepID=A0A1H5S9X3_9BACT|nr:DUF3761 domain-containing protein [Bryocella elongata]SEF46641.1 Protein of unknown function [Bryocella elongata]